MMTRVNSTVAVLGVLQISNSLTLLQCSGSELSQFPGQGQAQTRDTKWHRDGRLWQLSSQISPPKSSLDSGNAMVKGPLPILLDLKTPVIGFTTDQKFQVALIADETGQAHLVDIPGKKILLSHQFPSPIISFVANTVDSSFFLFLKNHRLWKLNAQGQAEQILALDANSAHFNAFMLPSPDGSKIALGFPSGKGAVYQISDGKALGEFQLDSPLVNLSYAAINDHFLASYRNGTLFQVHWDTARMTPFPGQMGNQIWKVAVDPLGNFLAVGSGFNEIQVFTLPGLIIRADFQPIQTNILRGVLWSKTASRLVGFDIHGKIHFWDSTTGNELLEIQGHDSPIVGMAEFPEGGKFLSLGKNGDMKVWKGSKAD